MINTLCIYHGNCADGYTAAWAVREHFRNAEKHLEVHPGFFSDIDLGILPDVDDKHVVLVDFSYPRKVIEDIRDRAASVLILDHHKTAQADLEGIKGVQSVFDMDRSGARIAWDFYHPGKVPPQMLLAVEDRDLWRFALRKTREIQANIFSYEYDFKAWDWMMKLEGAALEKFAVDGEAIERKHFKDIRELIKVMKRRMVIGGYDVPAANLPYTLTSDAANIMAKGEPFAACYYDTADLRIFGLRSQEDGIDVGEIAKLYGGGGHKHASGFRVPKGHELTH